jgi:REP element-mobilizing transposase RayT
MRDHVQMLVSIPQKYSVAHVIGYIKDKTQMASGKPGTVHQLQN